MRQPGGSWLCLNGTKRAGKGNSIHLIQGWDRVQNEFFLVTPTGCFFYQDLWEELEPQDFLPFYGVETSDKLF